MVNFYYVKQSKKLNDNIQTKNDSKVIVKLVIVRRFYFPYVPEGTYREIKVTDKLKDSITG